MLPFPKNVIEMRKKSVRNCHFAKHEVLSNASIYNTGCSSSVRSMSASYFCRPKINHWAGHILLCRFSPSSADSRRASCQILAKEWALHKKYNSGKLHVGGLTRNSVVK